MKLWRKRKTKEASEQCIGLLRTGKQTIPCPRLIPCPHHPEGKGIYDLTTQNPIVDFDDDMDGLTDSEKLDAIILLLEELNDYNRHSGETVGNGVESSEQLGSKVEEEIIDEGETNEETDSEIESDEQQSQVLNFGDLPSGGPETKL